MTGTDPQHAARIVDVYDHHGTPPAATWARVSVSTVRHLAWAAGRTLPGRGHPDLAELERRQPRLDCPCPWCTDIRTGNADPGPLADEVRERAQEAVKAFTVGSGWRHAATQPKGVTEPHPASWRNFAACRDRGADIFYGTPNERPAQRERREAAAIAICDACPARTACLEYALTNFPDHDDHGIWGATTTEQRAEIRSQRQKAAS